MNVESSLNEILENVDKVYEAGKKAAVLQWHSFEEKENKQ